MPKYQRFEDLPVWQEAARLYNQVLDLLEGPGAALTPGFRNQLDRAALSLASKVAESYDRFGAVERLTAIALARSSAAEVRSMLAVVQDRPKLKPCVGAFQGIAVLAESCARQLSGWAASIEKAPTQGRPPSAGEVKEPQPPARTRIPA
jgi:four helix bundle protein